MSLSKTHTHSVFVLIYLKHERVRKNHQPTDTPNTYKMFVIYVYLCYLYVKHPNKLRELIIKREKKQMWIFDWNAQTEWTWKRQRKKTGVLEHVHYFRQRFYNWKQSMAFERMCLKYIDHDYCFCICWKRRRARAINTPMFFSSHTNY